MAAKTGLTVAEFERMAAEDTDYELDEGELVPVSPTNRTHGKVQRRAVYLLERYLDHHPAGELYFSETGFVLSRNPAIVRAPDVAFVRTDRLAGTDPDSFGEGAPDLVIEVVSPTDTLRALKRKVAQYLKYGARVVWVVHPDQQEVEVHDASGSRTVVKLEGRLEAPDLLPGFVLQVRDLFAH